MNKIHEGGCGRNNRQSTIVPTTDGALRFICVAFHCQAGIGLDAGICLTSYRCGGSAGVKPASQLSVLNSEIQQEP